MGEQSMVEKVAEAIQQASFRMIRPAWDSLDPSEKEQWMMRAKAAIEAMRIPSKAMLDAVEAEEDKRGYIASAYESMDAETAWPVMIDAALKEQEKG